MGFFTSLLIFFVLLFGFYLLVKIFPHMFSNQSVVFEMPTTGTFSKNVVGEYYQQENISKLVQLYGLNTPLPALLFFKPDNPHDANAVGVVVGELFVGYISRENALAFHERRNKTGYRAFSCQAIITPSDQGRSNFGVKLNYSLRS